MGSRWIEEKLRRRLGLRGQRVGEASHPGPGSAVVTKKEAERQAKAAKALHTWLKRAEHECPNAVSTAKRDEAARLMEDVERLMKELADAVPPDKPPDFACPLCFDTVAEREEQVRTGTKYSWNERGGHGERSRACGRYLSG